MDRERKIKMRRDLFTLMELCIYLVFVLSPYAPYLHPWPLDRGFSELLEKVVTFFWW
jgi:hypothetical protein